MNIKCPRIIVEGLDYQAHWLFFLHLVVCLFFPQESPWINMQRIYVIFINM